MALPKNVKFITFDCYGTLIDWEEGVFEACSQEAERDGVELNRKEFLPIFFEVQAKVEDGSYELYAEVLRRSVIRAAGKVGWELEPSRAGFLPASIERWQPFKETKPVLGQISKKFEVGLLSNVDDKLLGASRMFLPVDFDLVVTAQQVRTYKPDDAHFKECARRIGSKKGWVHIASGYETDVVPCLKKRIPVIWVNRNKVKLAQKQKKPDREVTTLRAAANLLKPAKK